MNLVEIPEAGFKAEIPSHWDEMTQEQVEYCLKQAVFASRGIVDEVEAQVRCLYHVLDIERDWKSEYWERVNSKDDVDHKNSQAIILAEQLFSWIFKINERELLEVQYNTLTNHFPKLRSGKVQLHGPADMLTDLTFGEFRAAIEEMNEYFKTRSSKSLSRFLACLYRPAHPDIEQLRKAIDWNGIVREPFNPARLDINAQLTDKLSTVHRTGILLWFTFCIEFIQKNELIIGGQEINFNVLFSGGEGGSGSGWTGVLHAVAEKQIFGTADQVDQKNIFDLLVYMYDKEMENKKIKSKLRSKKA
jgi:hypothetical protein